MIKPDDFNPTIGVAEPLEPGLRRIVAPNPSPMTYRGTNTYLLGTRALAVIDPGPDNSAHLAAILAACAPDQWISHIIVTHSHLDHSPLARPLAQATGAPVLAFGDARAGRSAVMQRLAAAGLAGGGEGIDHGFVPDKIVADGACIDGDGWRLQVIHTPGHLGNHICLGWNDACLTADHVMGWASSLVSPPDGDLTEFMASCARLALRQWRVFYPGHGAPIQAPNARLDWLIGHRRAREAAVLKVLEDAGQSVSALTRLVYTDIDPGMLPAAERNLLAHLIDLHERGLVRANPELGQDARFALP